MLHVGRTSPKRSLGVRTTRCKHRHEVLVKTSGHLLRHTRFLSVKKDRQIMFRKGEDLPLLTNPPSLWLPLPTKPHFNTSDPDQSTRAERT